MGHKTMPVYSNKVDFELRGNILQFKWCRTCLKKELSFEVLALALTLFTDLIKTREKKQFCNFISHHIAVQWGKVQGIARLFGEAQVWTCYLGSASLSSKSL